MVYGLFRALPGDRALLPPSFADCSTTLTPASGRQDHMASPSANSAARLAPPKRPSHPAPNVRDDSQRPSWWDGMREMLPLIWGCDQCRRTAAHWHDGRITWWRKASLLAHAMQLRCDESSSCPDLIRASIRERNSLKTMDCRVIGKRKLRRPSDGYARQ